MTRTPRTETPSTRNTPLFGLLLGVVAALGLLGTGCGGSSDGNQKARPQLGEPSDQAGLTTWGQSLRAQDGQEYVPGFANIWDLDRDFAINSGGFNQFAVALTVRVDATGFPIDQDYDELTFRTPEFGTADGIVAAVVYDGSLSGVSVLEGNYSIAMAPTQNARLTQTLDLTSAVAPVTLDFDAFVSVVDSNFATEENFVDVSIKDTANGLLEQIYYRDSDGGSIGSTSADLSAYAGRIIRIAIEARTTAQSLVLFDDFSVADDDDTEFVTNGDFETGSFSGWSRNTPSFVRNVTTGVRDVDSLDVQRSFYAEPTARWSRMVDVFTNSTGATVDRTITYEVGLGSQGEGIIYGSDADGTIYTAPDTTNLAITTWDSNNGTRDIGWAFGAATSVDWTSDDSLSVSGNGNSVVTVTYDVSLAAGESIALAHFLVLDTDGTVNSASSVNDTADRVDDELQSILNGWPADINVNRYNSGLTQAQIDAVANF